MFKRYLEKKPYTQIAYFFSIFSEMKNNSDTIRTKTYNLLGYTMIFNGICTFIFLLRSIFPSLLSELIGNVYNYVPLSLTLIFPFMLIFSEKRRKFEALSYEKINKMISLQHKESTLLTELESLQKTLQLKKLEIFICQLKTFSLSEKLPSQEYWQELYQFITDNYEEIKDNQTLSTSDLSILRYEQEIEIGSIKKLL